MGIPDRPLINLIKVVRRWFSFRGSYLSCFSGKLEMSVTGSVMCCVCENFSEFYNRYHCQSCGRVFCEHCVGSYTYSTASKEGLMREDDNGCIKLCNYCSGGRIYQGCMGRYGERIYPSRSPDPVSPCSIGEDFDGNKRNELVQVDRLSHFLDTQNNDFTSNSVISSSFATSTSRSEAGEARDSEKHFFCSSNKCLYGISGIEPSSVSVRNEFDSYRSLSSSPSDSPSRINFTSTGVGNSVS